MTKGFCQHCSTMVEAEGGSHTRMEHDPNCMTDRLQVDCSACEEIRKREEIRARMEEK